MKKFLKEFKEFALKGTVLDMAVGVIIATAFTGIVKSLTENFINPILKLVTAGEKITVAMMRANSAAFLTEIVNFVITAFVLFCVVKIVTKAMSIGKKPAAPAPVTTKECPFCKTEIHIDASRCPNCTSELEAIEVK